MKTSAPWKKLRTPMYEDSWKAVFGKTERMVDDRVLG